MESFFLNYSFYTLTGYLLGIITFSLIVIYYRQSFAPRFTGTKDSPAKRTSFQVQAMGLMLVLSGIFLAVLIIKLHSAKMMYGSWFIQDDAFDSCIDPYQLLLGESIWGGGTNYLTYTIYLCAYNLFGYSLATSYSVNVIVFSISLSVLFLAAYRQFGFITGTFLLLVCITSYPLILHSIYATALTFSFLPVALMLFTLSCRNSFIAALLLVFYLCLSLFFYPGAFLTGICLLFFHFIFFPKWWRNLKTVTGVLISFLVMGPLTLFVKNTFSGNNNLSYWAGGIFSTHNSFKNSIVVFQDVFWKSTTWNAMNFNAPYFEPPVFMLLLTALLLLFLSINYKCFTNAEKWICIFLLTFFGSAALSALSGPYPGVRRVIASLPLLYIVCGLGAQRFSELNIARAPILILALVGILLIAGRSYFIMQHNWPLSHSSDFMEKSLELLANKKSSTKTIIIASYPGDQFQAQHYRCALGLNDNYQQQFSPPLIIPRISFNRNLGNISQDDSIVFFANENFSSAQLAKAFGKQPDISYNFMETHRPRPDKLVEAHVFWGKREFIPIEAKSVISVPSGDIKILSYVSKGDPIQYLAPIKWSPPDIELTTKTFQIPATWSELKTIEGFGLGASDNLRIRLSGNWEAQGKENIIFQVQADDGCRLMINGKVVIEYEGVHSFGDIMQSRPILLGAGLHEIVLDYFEWGGEAGLKVDWSAGGGEFHPLRVGQILP